MKDCDDKLIDAVLACAIKVHRELGPGLLEPVYQRAMMIELKNFGIPAQEQVEVPVQYQGQQLGIGFRADIIADDSLLLEIKSVKELTDTHLAQIMTYLRLLSFKRGYLLNFNKKLLKDGIKRVSI